MKTPALNFGKIVLSALAVLCLVSVGNMYGAARIWNDTSTDFNAAGSWTGGSPSGNNVARFDAAFGQISRP